MRLAIKLGKFPNGSYAAILTSVDQGGQAFVASSVGYTNPVLRVDCKNIRGAYMGTLNKAGTAMEGKWEQGGNSIDLNLKRAESIQADAKP